MLLKQGWHLWILSIKVIKDELCLIKHAFDDFHESENDSKHFENGSLPQRFSPVWLQSLPLNHQLFSAHHELFSVCIHFERIFFKARIYLLEALGFVIICSRHLKENFVGNFIDKYQNCLIEQSLLLKWSGSCLTQTSIFDGAKCLDAKIRLEQTLTIEILDF